MFSHSADAFAKLGEGCFAPLSLELPADLETPLTVYLKLSADHAESFLFESVTGGEQVARYSVIGVGPNREIRARGNQLYIDSFPPVELKGEDPLHVVEQIQNERKVISREGLPKFWGGVVACMGYDFVRYIEDLPGRPPDDLNLDTAVFLFFDEVVVFDHAFQKLMLFSIQPCSEAGYEAGKNKLGSMAAQIQRGQVQVPQDASGVLGEIKDTDSHADFEAKVRRTIEYIAAGDGIQMVISHRQSAKTEAHPVAIYRHLRRLNPSPYMFIVRMGDYDLVGASPELLCSTHEGVARVRPIAGTRPRGTTDAEDVRLAEALLADEKERAEHVMLVDLGRNDLGKISKPGSVRVRDLMVIERYSHVMHIVSAVDGELDSAKTAYDVVRATFPAGTLSGAPKVRAMQIIDELESKARGYYGGAVGYFTPNGDHDLAIAIRTVLLKNGVASVQAGAGIVYDSNPTSEWEETLTKSRAAMNAIRLASE
jgi:anthranilate synthase component I